nr:immunoglobulin light chain junction region [Macaca mulatta]
CHQSHRSPPTF